jgi:hypothetical protein
LLDRRLTNRRAAITLPLSKCQIPRIKQKVGEHGLSGIVHGNTGNKPVRVFSGELKEKIIDIVTERFTFFVFLQALYRIA